MKYTVECSLENFQAWSGGEDRLKVLREKGVCDEVEQFLEECTCDREEPMTETEINDYLWFEVENDFPQYFVEDEDEEEEEGEDD